MKRPKILEENNDLLEQVNYLIEMDKYCDYLEEQNKQLSIHDVSVSFDKGYDLGYKDATSEACKEIEKNYIPNER